jgi:hypothetical protein
MKEGYYQIEVVWNREFNYSKLGTIRKGMLDDIINYTQVFMCAGDGARVKKARIIDTETDEIVWNG